MVSTTHVRIDGVTVMLDGRRALADVSLELPQGAWTAIVGPNGAGKTTLLRAIAGIVDFSGVISLRGRSVDLLSRRERAREMAYVAQNLEVGFPVTVWEFAMMGRYAHQSSLVRTSAHDIAAVESALDTVGLLPLAKRDLTTLSGGERQRVLIAAALAQEAPLLLLDEPTTFLDPAQEEEVLVVLERARSERGLTVVSVTHHLNAASLFSSTVIGLNEGAVAFNGSMRELMTHDHLMRIYGRRFTLVTHPHRGVEMVLPG